MQIDPAALTASIGKLYGLNLERGLAPTLQQVVMAAKTLFHVDGAGLMLLAHRALIEQAKGVLMEREDLDPAAAFERLRMVARSSSRKVADVARDVLADVRPVSALL
jgi:hypothetical protein